MIWGVEVAPFFFLLLFWPDLADSRHLNAGYRLSDGSVVFNKLISASMQKKKFENIEILCFWPFLSKYQFFLDIYIYFFFCILEENINMWLFSGRLFFFFRTFTHEGYSSARTEKENSTRKTMNDEDWKKNWSPDTQDTVKDPHVEDPHDHERLYWCHGGSIPL